jgi:transcriptional regulator with XRE-family HTH domain
MPSSILTPEQCRAARGLLDWTQEELAERAGVSRSTVRDFEKGRHELQRATAAQIVLALEQAGVLLIPADEMGPGVRLSGNASPGFQRS